MIGAAEEKLHTSVSQLILVGERQQTHRVVKVRFNLVISWQFLPWVAVISDGAIRSYPYPWKKSVLNCFQAEDSSLAEPKTEVLEFLGTQQKDFS